VIEPRIYSEEHGSDLVGGYCPCSPCNLWPGSIVDVLHVARGAIRVAASGAVTRSAGRARRRAIDGVERQVTTVARETSFSVALNPGDNFHTLIVQRMELIAAPLLL